MPLGKPFGYDGQTFARSYSQTSPFTDTEQRQKKVLKTALGGAPQTPFGEWAKANPAPHMNFAPQQGAGYVQQLEAREKTPEMQDWMRRANAIPDRPGPPTNIPGVVTPGVGSTPQEHFQKGTAAGHDMSWMRAAPGFAPGAPPPGTGGLPASSPFQSDNASLGGFLQEAMAAKRGDIIKLAGEEERKKAAEDYIRSLVPELQKRGWTGGDIRNEKIQVDGQWRDLLRDIEGAAEAQYIVPDEGGPAGSLPGFASAASVDPTVSITSPDGARAHLEQILAAVRNNPALKRALSGTL